MREERGSTTPIVALLVVLAGVLSLGLGRMAGVADAKARAETAADAAALAGAGEDEAAARDIARADGAEVTRYERDVDAVQVSVRIGDVEARARATSDAAHRSGRGAPAGVDGLTPAMRAALDRAEQLLGERVPITSGWRSYSEQEQLYRHRASNPYPVAPPGTSAHERGTAVDVPEHFVARLASVAAETGLCHPWPDTDPVHFELCSAPLAR